MALPINLSPDQLQTKWKSQIDPVLANLLVQGRLVTAVPIVTGANAVNHGLGRNLIGWVVVGVDAGITLYDTQSTNPMKSMTLNLVSSGPANISLWVF